MGGGNTGRDVYKFILKEGTGGDGHMMFKIAGGELPE